MEIVDAVGRNCPEMRFEGTLSIGAIDVRRDRDCALSNADCAVTGGRRKVCALDEVLDTPMIFSILKDGLLEGSDLIMDAVFRLLS